MSCVCDRQVRGKSKSEQVLRAVLRTWPPKPRERSLAPRSRHRAQARLAERRGEMDNKARILFRQRQAEQRARASASGSRPAKAARVDAPRAGGPPPGFFDEPRSRAAAPAPRAGGPPPGFFDEPPSRGAAPPPPAAAKSGPPPGFFDDPPAKTAPSKARAPARPPVSSAEPAETNVLAMVMGEDSSSDEEEAAAERPSGPTSAADAPAEPEPAPRPAAAVPDGFFDSADAAKKARGEKVVKLTPAEELEAFERSVAADLEEAERREQEEAEAEVVEKTRREAEEHALRLDAVDRLKRAAEEARERAKRARKRPRRRRAAAGARRAATATGARATTTRTRRERARFWTGARRPCDDLSGIGARLVRTLRRSSSGRF